jgi:hypothetical protein
VGDRQSRLDIYPKWRDPHPFAYESTGIETRLTNNLHPGPTSRGVFAFHRAETLIDERDKNEQLIWPLLLIYTVLIGPVPLLGWVRRNGTAITPTPAGNRKACQRRFPSISLTA